MTLSRDVRQQFLDFFKGKGHAIIPSSSLVPEDDPSVLLTTAGMQQFKKYFTLEKDARADFGTQRAASVQKCFRTTDIEEVGDERHLTFFEMLGDFSFGPVTDDDPQNGGTGGYFKRAAIRWAYEFITSVLHLPVDYVTVFEGEGEVPFDSESHDIWREIGIPEDRIKKFGRADNFWGPTGKEGPCGPTTEIYLQGIEVWNLVFNEYYQSPDGKLAKLKAPGVDTGMGLERLMKVIQHTETVFETDLFQAGVESLRPMVPYTNRNNIRDTRVVLDHLRSLAFLISDGVEPGKTERGYLVRKLLRRYVLAAARLGIPKDAWKIISGKFVQFYQPQYPNLNEKRIGDVLGGEIERFAATLAGAERYLAELVSAPPADAAALGETLFQLFTARGLPLEVAEEYLKEKNMPVPDAAKAVFAKLMEQHQHVSRME